MIKRSSPYSLRLLQPKTHMFRSHHNKSSIVNISLVVFFVASIACLNSCNSNPKENFINYFEDKVDNLVEAMQNAQGSEKESMVSTWQEDGVYKTSETEELRPRMTKVITSAKELREHFRMVPFKLFMRLNDPDIGEWETELSNKVGDKKKRLKRETKKLEQDIRDHPNMYPNTWLTELTVGNPIYGWTKDKRLYVIIDGKRSGLIVNALLDLDIPSWLKQLQSQMDQEENTKP